MLFEKIKLESDEEVLLTIRKHWFVIVAELAAVVLVALLPFLILGTLSTIESVLANAGAGVSMSASFITFSIAAWLLLCTFSGFTIWTHYYLDLWIVTDRRIISVDQIHFFNRNVAIFRLERLQDIEFKVNGILATFLNFGAIKAQTAGVHESNFKATGMPDPRGLQATIQQATDRRIKALHMRPETME